MPLPVFAELGKSAKDILSKDYSYDKKLSLKSTTSSGVVFNAAGSSLPSGPIGGELAIKGKQGPAGISAKVDTAGKVSADLEVADAFTKGLKLVFRGLYPEPMVGTAAAEYRQDKFTATAFIDSGLKVGSSVVVGVTDSISAGGNVEYDTNKGVPTKYDAAVSYGKAGDFVVTAAARNKLGEYAASYVHHLNATTSVAGEFVHKKSDRSNTFTLGGLYKLDKTSYVRAKIDTEGVASVAYSQELRPKVTFVVAGQVNTRTLDKDSHKLGFALVIDQ
uniref:Non-selective channel of thylakoid membrane n=1 Tax=Cyanophora paradoxa TaxID=2762 RepID=A0A2Z5XCV6_CYAPA|nr:non-selective channel of thylakoid membrane [Cyanophora paradoxa]|eukprot:tig00000829_g4653.t1